MDKDKIFINNCKVNVEVKWVLGARWLVGNGGAVKKMKEKEIGRVRNERKKKKEHRKVCWGAGGGWGVVGRRRMSS